MTNEESFNIRDEFGHDAKRMAQAIAQLRKERYDDALIVDRLRETCHERQRTTEQVVAENKSLNAQLLERGKIIENQEEAANEVQALVNSLNNQIAAQQKEQIELAVKLAKVNEEWAYSERARREQAELLATAYERLDRIHKEHVAFRKDYAKLLHAHAAAAELANSKWVWRWTDMFRPSRAVAYFMRANPV
jgi:hypothetical protein